MNIQINITILYLVSFTILNLVLFVIITIWSVRFQKVILMREGII